MPPDNPRLRDGVGFFPPLGAGVPSLDDGAEDSCLADFICLTSGFTVDVSSLTVVLDVDFDAAGSFLTA